MARLKCHGQEIERWERIVNPGQGTLETRIQYAFMSDGTVLRKAEYGNWKLMKGLVKDGKRVENPSQDQVKEYLAAMSGVRPIKADTRL